MSLRELTLELTEPITGRVLDIGYLPHGMTITALRGERELLEMPGCYGQVLSRIPCVMGYSLTTELRRMDADILAKAFGVAAEVPKTFSLRAEHGQARFERVPTRRRRPIWLRSIPGPSRFKRRVTRAWKRTLPPVLKQVEWPTKIHIPRCRLTMKQDVNDILRGYDGVRVEGEFAEWTLTGRAQA